MSKLFLYDKASTSTDTLTVMRRKGYICKALTADPNFFWNTISEFDNYGIFVLLSHGDENGPLAVAGTQGDDIDLDAFSDLILQKGLTLYLLSCHTGLDPCGSILSQKGLDFVAPKGTAVFQTVGAEAVNVFSKDGGAFPGWVGPLRPSRPNKPLSLP